MNESYLKALEAAQKEIADLLPQHTAIEKRVAKLRQTIATLTALAEDEGSDDDLVYVPSSTQLSINKAVAGFMAGMAGANLTLSNAVREALKATGKPMTSVEVRDGLLRMGIDLENKYTSPLAVIHKALKRLDGKNEVRRGSIDGKTTYQWRAQSGPAAFSHSPLKHNKPVEMVDEKGNLKKIVQ